MYALDDERRGGGAKVIQFIHSSMFNLHARAQSKKVRAQKEIWERLRNYGGVHFLLPADTQLALDPHLCLCA